MKKNIIYSFLLVTIIAFSSCNKNLETKPTTAIDVVDALNTDADVQVALVGAYSALGGNSFYGGYVFVSSELLANTIELNWTGTFLQFTQFNNKTIPVDNAFVANIWLNGYTTINDVNNVLNALGVVNINQKSRVEGESKFLRACALFDLVKLYGKS